MPNLKTLSLERNRIKVLHEASFYNLVHIKLLDLGHNSIEKIQDEMFDKLNVIETILLSRNKLKEMKYHQFVRMPETLKTLNLASNDLTITSFDEKVNAFTIEYCRISLVVGFRLCPIKKVAQLSRGFCLLYFRCHNHEWYQYYLPQLSVSVQVGIQDLVKGGAPGAEAESCRRSEVESRERSEKLAAGVQGP